MSKTGYLAGLCLAGGLLLSPDGHADLYGAHQAYNKQDFSQAFALYRELAELGHPLAQENLALMYVSGEGVKRDNVLGYGWALIARDNGGGEAVQNIISQLEPHLTDTARKRVAELQAQYGKAALMERLLPPYADPTAPVPPPSTPDPDNCKFDRPANPDHFYPPQAIRQALSGTVLLDFTVAPDGRARNPRVVMSLPTLSFDAAAASSILHSTFKPKMENGVAVTCSIRVKVKFVAKGGRTGAADPDLDATLAGARVKAQAGDPSAQLGYGLLLYTLDAAKTGKESASPWFLKAAQAGLPIAQYMVGSQLIDRPDPQEQKKGLIWIQKAADAGQPDAQVELANYLIRQPGGDNRQRVFELLDRAAAAENLEGKYCLAALLASDPDESRRDARRALTLIDQVMIDKNFDPTAWEIRAAANAMLGDFKNAQKDQKRALQMAQKFGWDVAPQRERLGRYESNAAWTGDLRIL